MLGEAICAEGAVALVLMPAQHTYGLTFNSIAVPTPDETIRIPGLRVGPVALPPGGETRLTGSQTFDLPANGHLDWAIPLFTSLRFGDWERSLAR